MIKKTCFLSPFFLFFIACSSNQTTIKSNNFIKPTKKEVIISFKEYKKTFEENIKKEKEEIVFDPIITPEEYKSLINEENNSITQDSLSTNIEVKEALMEFYNEWKNVKYKFGGNSKRGIDCSAFTQRIFKEKFNIKIPRTTISQVKKGQKINKSELQMGDLVFFKSKKHGRHVGIYMDNGEFMHASIKGIKFSKLNKNYYKKNYWTSRRVLN